MRKPSLIIGSVVLFAGTLVGGLAAAATSNSTALAAGETLTASCPTSLSGSWSGASATLVCASASTTTTVPPTTTTTPPATTGSLATLATDASALGFSNLAWDDNFSEGFSTANWNYGVTSAGSDCTAWSSSNISTNTDSDVTTDSSGLVLTAEKSGSSWTNGAVSTCGKHEEPAGTTELWEVDAELPDSSSGLWPAIWFLPDGGQGETVDNGEIDLDEGGMTGRVASSVPENDVVASTYHPTPSTQYATGYNAGVALNDGFHVYAIVFVPGKSVTFYLDGVKYWTETTSVTSYEPELILDNGIATSVDSGFHTSVSASTPSPAYLTVSGVAEYTQ